MKDIKTIYNDKVYIAKWEEPLKGWFVVEEQADCILFSISIAALQDLYNTYEVIAAGKGKTLFQDPNPPEKFVEENLQKLLESFIPNVDSTLFKKIWRVTYVTDEGAHLIVFTSSNENAARSFEEFYIKKHNVPETSTYISSEEIWDADEFIGEEDYKKYMLKQK